MGACQWPACSEQSRVEGHGWRVVEVFEGRWISDAKGRDKRPGLDRLLKAVARRGVDMVAAWSVDRPGRSPIDLLDFPRELHATGVDLYQRIFSTPERHSESRWRCRSVNSFNATAAVALERPCTAKASAGMSRCGLRWR
jgi:Resolvase, N terminal domain